MVKAHQVFICHNAAEPDQCFLKHLQLLQVDSRSTAGHIFAWGKSHVGSENGISVRYAEVVSLDPSASVIR